MALAGCDMFLVPSMFEPCGLTQMIAMQVGCRGVGLSLGLGGAPPASPGAEASQYFLLWFSIGLCVPSRFPPLLTTLYC